MGNIVMFCSGYPRGASRFGFEMKMNQAPTLTRSMMTVLEDLRLDRLWVIYPGLKSYPLAERIVALPLRSVFELEI